MKDSGTGVAGTDFDQIVLTGGTLALGAQSTLDIRFIGSATAPDTNNPFWQSSHTWKIISLSGGSNPGQSNFGRVMNGSYAAGNFTTSVDGSGNIVLTFLSVIEVELWGDNTWGQSGGLPWAGQPDRGRGGRLAQPGLAIRRHGAGLGL